MDRPLALIIAASLAAFPFLPGCNNKTKDSGVGSVSAAMTDSASDKLESFQVNLKDDLGLKNAPQQEYENTIQKLKHSGDPRLDPLKQARYYLYIHI